jgi:hypothetical protein
MAVARDSAADCFGRHSVLQSDREANRRVASVSRTLRLSFHAFEEDFGQVAILEMTEAGGVGEAAKLKFDDFMCAAIGETMAIHCRASFGPMPARSAIVAATAGATP